MKKKTVILLAMMLAAVAARRFITSDRITFAEAAELFDSKPIRAALAAVGRFSSPADVIEAFNSYGEAVEISSVR